MTARRFATGRVIALTAFAAFLTAAPVLAQPSSSPLPPWRERSLTFTGSYLASIVANGDRDTEAAAGFLGRALSRDPNDPILIERTFLTRLTDADVVGALSLARRLAQMDGPSQNPFVPLTLAAEAIRSGDFAEAETQLNLFMPDNPVAAVTQTLLLAWVKQGLGQTDEALDTIHGFGGPDWYSLFANYQSGLINSVAGRGEAAIADFRATFEIDGSVTRMTESYVRQLANAGEFDEAREVLATQPANHPVLSLVAADIEAGRTPALPVSGPASGAAEVLYTIGSAIGTDAEELSTVYLSLALHLDPASDYAAVALADVYQSLQRFEKAAEAFGAIPDSSPFAAAAQIQRAVALDALDRTDEAVAELQAMLETAPDDVNANVTLADILSTSERFEEALPYYTAAIENSGEFVPDDWRLFFRRGVSYERTGQWELAEPDFFQALELMPDEPRVLNYLGYTWADMGINLDRALDMIQTAVDLRPNDGYIVDSLGWAYYQLGRYDEAVTHLERAVQLSPEDPTLNDHLGDAYWQVGRRREAVFQWNHARDLDPEPDDLALILDKIENGLTPDAIKREG